ncbi:MAG: ribosome maturation factor RimM, partial [Chromatiales bacterium]
MSLETGPEQRIVVLGRLSGLYGVQGWLKVYSDTEPREGIIKYPRWWVKQQGSWREIRVEQGRRQGKGVVVKLKGIDDRDAAAKLLNAEVAVDRNE